VNGTEQHARKCNGEHSAISSHSSVAEEYYVFDAGDTLDVCYLAQQNTILLNYVNTSCDHLKFRLKNNRTRVSVDLAS